MVNVGPLGPVPPGYDPPPAERWRHPVWSGTGPGPAYPTAPPRPRPGGTPARRVAVNLQRVADMPTPLILATSTSLSAGLGIALYTGQLVHLLVLWAIGAAVLAGGWKVTPAADRASRTGREAPTPPHLDPVWLRANGMPTAAALIEAEQPPPALPSVAEVVEEAEEAEDGAVTPAHLVGGAVVTRLSTDHVTAAPGGARMWAVPCLRCPAEHRVSRLGNDVAVLPAHGHVMLRLIDSYDLRCPGGGSYVWKPAEGFTYRIVEPADALLFSPEES